MDNQEPSFQPFTSDQTRVYSDAVQVAEAYRAAKQSLGEAGWMTWKRSNGTDYLFHGKGGAGNGQSLGARTPEKEAQLEEFSARKTDLQARVATLEESLLRHAKYVKVERLNRLPMVAGKIINLLAKAGVAHNLRVIGTHSLYAYEALGAVLFSSAVRATRDLDLLWDTRTQLTFTGDISDVDVKGFSAVLKKADPTFTVSAEKSFRAINAQGYAVDFLMSEPDDGRRATRGDKVFPMGLQGQAMLNDAPLVEQAVFMENGLPCWIRTIDPRYFVLHKRWVAARPDRQAGKNRRDVEQADAVQRLLAQLPMYRMEEATFLAQLPTPLASHTPAAEREQARALDESGL
jgi:hypothetical protein